MITSNGNAYSSHVKAIVQHYRNTPGQAYPLPVNVSDRTQQGNIEDEPEVKAWLTSTETSSVAAVDAAQKRAEEAFEQYKKDKDKDALKKSILDIAQDLKGQMERVIDFSAETATALGEKHPEWQDRLLVLFDKANRIVLDCVSSSKDFFSKLVESILNVFEIIDVVSQVKSFFKKLITKAREIFSKPATA